jgi:hypothetical protein
VPLVGEDRRRAAVPSTSLDTADAVELAELLQFITDWLGSDRHRRRSFAGFVGHPAYGIDELQHDLRRFTFLLGADDGESLFRANWDNPDGEDQ